MGTHDRLVSRVFTRGCGALCGCVNVSPCQNSFFFAPPPQQVIKSSWKLQGLSVQAQKLGPERPLPVQVAKIVQVNLVLVLFWQVVEFPHRQWVGGDLPKMGVSKLGYFEDLCSNI